MDLYSKYNRASSLLLSLIGKALEMIEAFLNALHKDYGRRARSCDESLRMIWKCVVE